MSEVDALAAEAVAPVKGGMVVGLGTGRAASRAIRALSERAKNERLRVVCVATSGASAELGASLGLRVEPFADVERVDYLFDGADEVDPALRMIKGRGGAMTREKIVARASARRVYLVDDSKLVSVLGVRARLPIEVLPFGLASIRAALWRLRLDGSLRMGSGGEEYRTDNGGAVVDARVPAGVDLALLAQAIATTPGVLGHGLFLSEADEVLVERRDGSIERRHRPR